MRPGRNSTRVRRFPAGRDFAITTSAASAWYWNPCLLWGESYASRSAFDRVPLGLRDSISFNRLDDTIRCHDLDCARSGDRLLRRIGQRSDFLLRAGFQSEGGVPGVGESGSCKLTEKSPVTTAGVDGSEPAGCEEDRFRAIRISDESVSKRLPDALRRCSFLS